MHLMHQNIWTYFLPARFYTAQPSVPKDRLLVVLNTVVALLFCMLGRSQLRFLFTALCVCVGKPISAKDV